MDKLDQIFQLQEALDRRIIEGYRLNYDTETWIQKESLALFVEMAEVLDEVNYKWWKNPKAVQTDKLKEELADVFHFFVSICLKAGMDAEELFRIYAAKNEENILRQEGLSEAEGYRPE